ncbi:MAG: single-stranded DNA-binding protein [Ginsengibacter sp.]
MTIMEIIGRVTKDATVTTTKDERKVVNFSIVINDSFKHKGNFERVIITNYVSCAYWMKPGLVQHLTKGKLVELSGRIGVNAYKDHEGEAKANLTFHANSIKFHGNGKLSVEADSETAKLVKQSDDDLPF